MSEYNDTVNDLQKMLDLLRIENAALNLSRLSAGLFTSIYDVNIENLCDFNMRNYQYMLYHMYRNIKEKNITLASVSTGINAYENGDSDNIATPAMKPRYTDGNNYIDFVKGEKAASNNGKLSTRVDAKDSLLYQTNNKYFDITDSYRDNENTGSGEITETGDAWTDANSILFKTKQLWRRNKIKTIISEFHTKDVKYVGQARTEFGESHGRNLLTKQAETNPSGNYDTNGYNNPYCRVWTHHHRYSKFKNGMRANADRLLYWGSNFEWTEDEKKDAKTRELEYNDGENYDYAWRGRHNQDRKRANTVLDYETGLVNIAPKYLGGQGLNIHTKSCMFSIENLAWKDYDPYTFEQSLSWEQRGPLGGRIMWFPPYGLTINETSNTNWSSNDFIGRGEKVYTYVNTERTGNLSFIMLTDHPSSVDYASWYGDAENLNTHTDYLRYFAGCNEGKTADNEFIKGGYTGSEKGTIENGMNNDMLIKRPPNLTDEYPQDEGTTKIVGTEKKNPPITNIPDPESNDITVEFFIFYPNNYSGYYDMPQQNGSDVDAIAYLLAGFGAQREFSGRTGGRGIKYTKDIPITPDNFSVQNAIGYEMRNIPVTQSNSNDTGNYMVGSASNQKYTPTVYRYWKYRIDAKQDEKDTFKVNSDADRNHITESLYDQTGKTDTPNNINYSDTISYSFNLKANDKVKSMASDKDSVYSFAEVATAFYSDKVKDVPAMYNYLNGLDGLNKSNVNKLIELFSDETRKLTSISVKGLSNSHGYNQNKTTNVKRNTMLARNRARTAMRWLKGYSKWTNVINTDKDPEIEPGKSVGPVEKYNASGENAKLYRSAHVVMVFSTSKVVSENNSSEENIHNQFTKITGDVGGTTPEFSPRVYFKYTGHDSYEPLINKPDDWDENYSNYYIRISTHNLDTVNVIGNREASNAHNVDTSSFKEYVGFKHVKEEYRDDGQIWNYYQQDGTINYYEQVVESNNDSDYEVVNPEEGATVTESQIIDLLNKYRDGNIPYGKNFESRELVIEQYDTYKGVYSENGGYNNNDNVFIPYSIDDVIKQQDRYYKSHINFASVYGDSWWDVNNWSEINEEYITQEGLNFMGTLNTNPSFGFEADRPIEYGDIVYFGDNDHISMCVFNFDDDFVSIEEKGILNFDILGHYYQNDIVYFQNERINGLFKFNSEYNGDVIWRETEDDSDPVNFDIEGEYHTNDVVKYNEIVYEAVADANMGGYLSQVPISEYNPSVSYRRNDAVYRYNEPNCFYMARRDITVDLDSGEHFTSIITFDNLITDNDGNPNFIPGYGYSMGNVCRKVVPNGYRYYRYTSSEPTIATIPFNANDWILLNDTDTNNIIVSWEATKMLEKASEMLGYSVDKLMKEKILNNPNASVFYTEPLSELDFMWKYGQFEDYYGYDGSTQSQRITTDTNLGDLAITTVNDNADIFTDTEERYLQKKVEDIFTNNESTLIELLYYISGYRLLRSIRYIEMVDGNGNTYTRDVLNNTTNSYDDMALKSEHISAQECESKLWIDRGDGVLIQECYLKNLENGIDYSSEREKDLNKLRYDQEYYFYKKYMEDHPFVFEKLQEKIQYFEPAFHSMTPEGFNARLTFLQQCTRQGKTKTMSDEGGVTANNLAFGRPPFCVLRLGDFYNQMIVINSISYDYSISDGLQWDLNAEGNGVQPMLAKVNIDFKFIGGGDITGPVRRLQDAMSFNYYANASFYDNRADRVEYQDTNYKTMGGAGNNQINTDKSYVYKAAVYSENEDKILRIK